MPLVEGTPFEGMEAGSLVVGYILLEERRLELGHIFVVPVHIQLELGVACS